MTGEHAFELIFCSASPRRFTEPEMVLVASTPDEAWSLLADIEPLRARGFAVGGFLSYELGYSCIGVEEPARNATTRALPYAVLGVFDPRNIRAWTPRDVVGPFAVHDLRARMPFDRYGTSFARIMHGLHNGDFYQINLSVPHDFRYDGEPDAGFARLCKTTRAPYAAYLGFGDTALLSLSPELFLDFRGGTLTTKPMKGTAARNARSELYSAKNRAEHVMIVDLLRNDLARVCDRVRVDALFTEERYPTFATLTSTICGDLRKSTPFHEIICALFPCGSITGAPKRAAVVTIAELEDAPRDAYCGTIGYLMPDGTGEWNVAIRTAQLDVRRGIGRLDLGGGIVADSGAAAEWRELEIKGRFLETAKFSEHDGL